MNHLYDRERDGFAGDTIVRSMRLLLLIHLAAGHLVRHGTWANDLSQSWRAVTMGTALVVCIATFRTRWQRLALLIALPLQLYQVYEKFPAVANHLWVETLLLLALLLVAESDDDNVLYRQFACWLAVIVFFYSGLQKFWYGTYFDGQYLATKIALFEHYRVFFAWFVPAEDIARLQSYAPLYAGAGPFRIESLSYLVVVNLVWITEIVAALLLLFRRTRFWGLVFGLLVILGIELVAREVFFGVLYVAVCLAFLRRDGVRWLIPAAAALYVYLILTTIEAFDWLPTPVFYP